MYIPNIHGTWSRKKLGSTCILVGNNDDTRRCIFGCNIITARVRDRYWFFIFFAFISMFEHNILCVHISNVRVTSMYASKIQYNIHINTINVVASDLTWFYHWTLKINSLRISSNSRGMHYNVEILCIHKYYKVCNSHIPLYVILIYFISFAEV